MLTCFRDDMFVGDFDTLFMVLNNDRSIGRSVSWLVRCTGGWFNHPGRSNFHSSSVQCPAVTSQTVMRWYFNMYCSVSRGQSGASVYSPWWSGACWFVAWSCWGPVWTWSPTEIGSGSFLLADSAACGQVNQSRHSSPHLFNSISTCWSGITYVLAAVFLEGIPSNTMTLSARYVAMMKSCSTTNAVFFAWRMYLKKTTTRQAFKDHLTLTIPSEGGFSWPFDDPSRHQSLLGVQVRRGLVNQVNVGWFTQAQGESHSLQLTSRQVLHLWGRVRQLSSVSANGSLKSFTHSGAALTSWSMMLSICIGFMTSVMNCGWV